MKKKVTIFGFIFMLFLQNMYIANAQEYTPLFSDPEHPQAIPSILNILPEGSQLIHAYEEPYSAENVAGGYSPLPLPEGTVALYPYQSLKTTNYALPKGILVLHEFMYSSSSEAEAVLQQLDEGLSTMREANIQEISIPGSERAGRAAIGSEETAIFLYLVQQQDTLRMLVVEGHRTFSAELETVFQNAAAEIAQTAPTGVGLQQIESPLVTFLQKPFLLFLVSLGIISTLFFVVVKRR